MKLHASGRQIAVHCNGDGAVEAFLNAVEAALAKFPRENHRHRIEHCQIVSEEQLARMKKLGVVASFFIGHVYYWGDRHHNRFLGPERAQRISPLRSALNNNVCSFFFTVFEVCLIYQLLLPDTIWITLRLPNYPS